MKNPFNNKQEPTSEEVQVLNLTPVYVLTVAIAGHKAGTFLVNKEFGQQLRPIWLVHLDGSDTGYPRMIFSVEDIRRGLTDGVLKPYGGKKLISKDAYTLGKSGNTAFTNEEITIMEKALNREMFTLEEIDTAGAAVLAALKLTPGTKPYEDATKVLNGILQVFIDKGLNEMHCI